jgi:hypothetical protein
MQAEDDSRAAFHAHARVRSRYSSHRLSSGRLQSLHPADLLEERLQGVSKLYWELSVQYEADRELERHPSPVGLEDHWRARLAPVSASNRWNRPISK